MALSQERTNEILERVAERQVELEDSYKRDITRVNGLMVEVANSQQRTNAILEVPTEKHVELANATEGLVNAQKATEEKLVELANAQKVTEEKLHVCIDTVERHIANHNSSQG